jgi:hypothetical protein
VLSASTFASGTARLHRGGDGINETDEGGGAIYFGRRRLGAIDVLTRKLGRRNCPVQLRVGLPFSRHCRMSKSVTHVAG